MTTQLVRLRFTQLYRASGELGLFRMLLVGFVLLPLAAIFIFQNITVRPWPFALPGAVLFVTWLVHGKRRDYHFLLSAGAHPKQVFLAEYFIFTLPVTLLLFFSSLFIPALGFCGGLILIALQRPSQEVNPARTLKFSAIPDGMFEWQVGIRKNIVIIVLSYIAGLFGFFSTWFPVVSVFLLATVFTSFYSEYEPVNMLRAGGFGSWRFLARKIALHTACFALLLLPLLITALFREEYRAFVPGYYLALLNLLVFSIILKYYQYRPSAVSGPHQLLTILACVFSVLLPVALLIFAFNLFLFFGACRNLQNYLDDRN
jgi:hypothetical protein